MARLGGELGFLHAANGVVDQSEIILRSLGCPFRRCRAAFAKNLASVALSLAVVVSLRSSPSIGGGRRRLPAAAFDAALPADGVELRIRAHRRRADEIHLEPHLVEFFLLLPSSINSYSG